MGFKDSAFPVEIGQPKYNYRSGLSKGELVPGDKFRDSIGCLLQVLEVGPERGTGIPRTKPKIRLRFVTEAGNQMFCDYSADRRVEVENE